MDAKQPEKDLNDLFEDIAFPEQIIVDDAFQEGLPKGELEGKCDGYHLGYHRGLQIGTEIGFYKGVIDEIIQSTHLKDLRENDKVAKLIKKIIDSINEFPSDNSQDVDIISPIIDIRINFRKLMSLLKLKLSYRTDTGLSF